METRGIGSVEVGVAGLGTNNFGMRIGRDESLEVIAAALDAGITLFDTADVYAGGRCEEILGEALAEVRDEVVIATKFGWTAAPDRASVSAAVEGSLRRLRTDHVDVLYCHRPQEGVPLAETLGAMGELVAAGKVREIGCSNVTAADVAEWVAAADAAGVGRPACVEDQYNLLFRSPEAELVPAAVDAGMAFVPFFPLANGLLTGKYRVGAAPDPESRLGWALERVAAQRGVSVDELTADGDEALKASMEWHPHEQFDLDLGVVGALHAFAAESGRTMLELALGWLAAQPSVPTVIAGARTAEQIRANVAATSCDLTVDELAELDRITAG
jgi:aryl-alcohol dehydrogenase-like predicted oxidoreductase